ncbi:hypothetical protein ALC62_01835 [Cyphomyrmex costatus]|uniref:Uncharacterized protein n=1 Tax=Cyphomyrmex costatus TaxID=456900 RepID=A0A151INX3_9HYME|nr:hypothetical protein ALC62_01835 [Cyphomyrmex costatus]
MKDLKEAVISLVPHNRRGRTFPSIFQVATQLDKIARRAITRDTPSINMLDEEIMARDIVADMMASLKMILSKQTHLKTNQKDSSRRMMQRFDTTMSDNDEQNNYDMVMRDGRAENEDKRRCPNDLGRRGLRGEGEWAEGKLRDSSELFRSIVTLITGDRLQGSNPSIDKRWGIKVPPPISCSRAKNGRTSEFDCDFGSSLFHHDRWIARWARGVSLELSYLCNCGS